MDPTAPVPFVALELTWSRADEAQVRETAILRRLPETGEWDEVGRTTGTSLVVRGLHPERTHEFAAAAVFPDGTLAAEGDWERVRVSPLASPGAPARPAAPSGFAVAQDGPVLHARWDPAPDGVTGSCELRVGASWENGLLVARDLRGGAFSWPWWTSGDHVFHLRGQDRLGRYSAEEAAFALMVAPLVDHVDAGELDEGGGGWPGTVVGGEVDGAALRHEHLGRFGAAEVPFGAEADTPCHARYRPVLEYESEVYGAPQFERERLEVDVGATQAFDAGLPFGAVRWSVLRRRRRRDGDHVALGRRRPPSRASWQMAALPPVDLLVEIDTSPTTGGGWDGWRPFVPGEYGFRRARVRCRARGDGLRFVRLPRLLLRHRRRNKKDEGVVELGAGDTVVTFAVPFVNAPTVTFAAVGFVGAFEIVSVSPTQAAFRAYELPNPSGTYDPGPYEPPAHEDANAAGVPDTYTHPPYAPATLDTAFAARTQRTSGEVHWQAMGA